MQNYKLLLQKKYSRTPIIRTPIIRNAYYPNTTLTKVFEVCNHFSHCNMSSMKKKGNVLTIETKLEIIKQLEKGVSGDTNHEVLTDEEECDESDIKGPTHAEAFDAFETAMAWCEQNECLSTQLLFLKKMRDLAANKRVTNLKQKKNE